MLKTVLALVLVAACGGGSKQSGPAKPAEPAPVAPAEPEAKEPAKPAEPEPAKPDPEKMKAELAAAETAAFEKAKPVFDKHCASCHEKGKKGAKASTLKHFDMSAYPFAGGHAADIDKEIRKVLAIGGGKATMPKSKPGAVKGDELALIAAWAEAFDAAHEGGAGGASH